MTIGMTTAAARMRRVSMSRMVTAGGDSSSTGSSVQADIDHSEVISMPLTSAATAGSSNGAQNAAAASRRSVSAGHSMSAIVARFAPRRDQHDDHRNRHIADRAGEIAERAERGGAERLVAVHDHGIGERLEMMLDRARARCGAITASRRRQ